jgi:hypothetical protein
MKEELCEVKLRSRKITLTKDIILKCCVTKELTFGCHKLCVMMLQLPPHQLKLELKHNIDRHRNGTAMSNVYPPANGNITRIVFYSSLRLSHGNAQLFYKYHVT